MFNLIALIAVFFAVLIGVATITNYLEEFESAHHITHDPDVNN